MEHTSILKKYFGFDAFRTGQEQLVREVLSSNDVLGIMPTGGGKSLCFQLPAIMLDGITLVISPLISLMKDQVYSLNQIGIRSAYLNSSLNQTQIQKAYQNILKGEYKIIYVAPERLNTPSFLNIVSKINISMITIDEAHCVSQWGQDFRPSYTRISEFIETFDKRPVISAYTATATAKVQSDIIKLLGLNSPFVSVNGFDRKNLYFEVINTKNKNLYIEEILKENKGKSGIIYCQTRKKVEELSENLNKLGYNTTRYHAGLTDSEKNKNQDDFIFDRVNIIIATNAFGMGIDKSNVSFVIHHAMPKDLESYYQEAGRAGRDGTSAKCYLLYAPNDVATAKWLITNSTDYSEFDEETSRKLLQNSLERLKQMTFFSTTDECLREFMLRYFGERSENFCGNCSNCGTKFVETDYTLEAQKILSCIKRVNEKFGISTIIEILTGSSNAKIKQFGLDQIPTYGISKVDNVTLRKIVDHLILNDYIFRTEERYPILKLGENANEILYNDKKIILKTPIEKKKILLKSSKNIELSSDKIELFDELKALRQKIAKRRSVPSYVIFSDKTLIDMCQKMPTNDDEFLLVLGVGELKLKNFGKEFLDLIKTFISK